jgi:hypothetical protein
MILAQAETVMTTSAWVFMGLAWFFVIGLVFFSFKRVLGGPKA